MTLSTPAFRASCHYVFPVEMVVSDPSSRGLFRWLLCLLAIAVVSGCATTEFVKLRRKPHNPLVERLHSTRFGDLAPSERTNLYLSRSGYDGPAELQPMLYHCANQLRAAWEHDALYALAELRYIGARSVARHDAQLAGELYLDASQAAWFYFMTPDPSGRIPDPTEVQHREAAELYNGSCESLLRVIKAAGPYELGQSLLMPLSHRRIILDIPYPNSTIHPENLAEFEFVSDFKLTNLRNHHRSPGLGVPLVAYRRQPQQPHAIEEYYTEQMGFAATALLRFAPPGTTQHQTPISTFADAMASTYGFNLPANPAVIQLQLFDPRETDGVVIQNSLVPLQTDLSTPLARALSNPDLKLLDTWAFFRPDHARAIEGLYMVQPYDPDRIPVLMVHGIWSSPMTWMEMFNDLQADPEIRRRYQFWFYLYPTGEPLPFAAANLRQELANVRMAVDPQRQNDKLDQMVMVGHSMGGLIAHLMTIESGNRLWDSVSPVPFHHIQAPQEHKAEMQRVFYFHRNPSVARIVTIASPYDGSRYSNAFTRWLSGSLVWLPNRTMQLTRLLSDYNESVWSDRVLTPRTSLDSLTRESAILQLIQDTPVPLDVPHHNVVGVRKGKSPDQWTDGVVNFRSAHLEDVDSEVIIRAGHSQIQRHPDTIAEVRRVLIEHLHELNQTRSLPLFSIR
ncbi:MAG: alpha/beta hydrolase [Planctomycetaceae bacterium]